MNTQELERSISAAHERNDTAALERLQAQYRATAGVVRVTRDSIRLVERSVPVGAPEASPAPEPTGTAPSVVRLRREAYSTIVNDWPHAEGLECGGYLVGYEADGEIVVEVVFAANGADPRGERERLVLNREWLDTVNDRVEPAGWKVVGDAHTHVYAEPKLSGTDERGLRGASDAMNQHWIGLVVGRDKDRVGWTHEWLWLKPEINAFIAVHGDRSVRPIELVVEGVG
jgi:proteasome lid subunit RPN8/RPN11